MNAAALDNMSAYVPAGFCMVAFLVDHPIYHKIRLQSANLTYLVLHITHDGKEYADRFYKNINQNMFIPHAGTMAECVIPYADRKYKVVLSGGYSNPVEIMKQINELPGMLPVFCQQMIKLLCTDETISWETAIEKVCVENGLSLKEEQLEELGGKTVLADRFFRNYMRERIVKVLIEAGVEVDVFGNGWEQLECDNKEYLHIHAAVSYEEVLNIIADSKIVLNMAPAHNSGSHERIFDAMLNGAICFTNYSSYLKEAGLEDLVVMYSIQEMNVLPEMVKLILNNEAAAEEITKQARECAVKNHTWKNRAEEIISFVEAYKAEYTGEIKKHKNIKEQEFYEFCHFIEANNQELLLEKMKSAVQRLLRVGNGYMQRALQSYNRYGYWGTFSIENGDYQLLENRAAMLKEHLRDFIWMYEHLEDEHSRIVLYEILRYWIDYEPYHLNQICNRGIYDQYFDYDLVSCTEEEVFVDCGSYTGDTVLSFIKNYGTYKKIYCYEISEEAIEKSKYNLKLYDNIVYRQCALGDSNRSVFLNLQSEDASANRISNENTGKTEVKMVTLDEDIKEPISFLKMDIEGALLGAKQHIQKDHPKLAISVYHNNEDIWKIAQMIHEMDAAYRFYLRYYGGALYPSEYVLYAL